MSKEYTPSTLAVRTVSALVVAPAALLLLWWGGLPLCLGIAAVITVVVRELSGLVRRMGYRPLSGASYLICALLLLGMYAPAYRGLLFLLAAVGITLTLSGLVIRRQTVLPVLPDWIATALMPFYIALPLACLLVLRGYSVWWALLPMLTTWAFDTGAYLVGRRIGRRKLAPRISPNKTWEGFWGGMVCAMLVSCLCTLALPVLSWYAALLFGFIISVVATCGDLFESFLKRQAKVKDSGRLMPGHGGALDRIDGLLFSIFVATLFAQFYIR